MFTQRNACGICGEPMKRPSDMCGDCVRAYDKAAHDDASVMYALLWAARRARWYAQRRRRARACQWCKRPT